MSMLLKIGRAANALCKKTYWYNNVLFPDCSKFWNQKTFNLDVANLGSTSSVHAFNYEGIPLKCANWALGHNPLSGDEAILKNYLSYLNPNKSTVIISLCPFSGLAGSYECDDDRYYALLYPNSINSFNKHRKERVVHMKDRPLKYYPLYELLKDIARFLSSPFKRNHSRPLSEEELEKDSQHWFNSWKKEFSINSFDNKLSLINRDAINDAIEIEKRLVLFCKERNITPVFVIPPVYHTLAVLFTKEIKCQLIESITAPLKKDNIRFVNFLEDSDFAYHSDLFTNSFFLNEKGASLFTNKLLREIGLI